MALTLEKIAEKVHYLEGQTNGIVGDIKEIKVQLGKLDSKLGKLDSKTETDKNEILLIIEKNKNEMLQKTDEVLLKTSTQKFELVKWMIGLFVGFSAIIITAIWAMLSFAVKNMDITSALQEIISKFNP